MKLDRRQSDPALTRDKAGGRVVVVYRSISDVKLDPLNPRAHSPRQIRQIARSIEAFGFVVPVLVDAPRQDNCRTRPHISCPVARVDRGPYHLPQPSDRGASQIINACRQPPQREPVLG